MCVRCSNVVPCARYVHLLLLPVYTQHTRTHARTHTECEVLPVTRRRSSMPWTQSTHNQIHDVEFETLAKTTQSSPMSSLSLYFLFFFVFRCSLGFSLDSHATIGTYPRRPKKSRTPRSLAQRRATPSSAKIRRDSHLFHLPREISWGLRSIRTERNAQIFRRVFSPFLLFLTLSLSLTRSLCLTRSFSTVSNSVSPIPSVSFLRLPSHGAIVLPHLQLLTGHQLRDHINPRDGKIDARRF